MLSKHDPSKMSRFFHDRSFTVDGLPINFRHMNVCNTNAGNVIPEKEDFIPEKMIYYPLQTIFLQRIFKAI